MSVPHKLIVRLHAAADPFGPADFVPVFHRIIQADALPGHLLIDVADYAHVPNGPGTLLVAREANVHMDRSDGRLGLTYVRKLPVPDADTLHATMAVVLRDAFAAADLIERDEAVAGRLQFDRSTVVVRFNDRLLTPNTPATADAVTPAVTAAAERVFGLPVSMTVAPTPPPQLLELRLTVSGRSSP